MKKIFGCVGLTAIVLGICATNIQATSGKCSLPEGSWQKVCNLHNADIKYDEANNQCTLSVVCQHVKHGDGVRATYSWVPFALKFCSETKELVQEGIPCPTGTAPSK